MDSKLQFTLSAEAWSFQEAIDYYSELLCDLYSFDCYDVDQLIQDLDSSDDDYAGCYSRMLKRFKTLRFVGCNIPFVFVNGVPGGGKTKYVKDNVPTSGTNVIVPFRGLRDDYRSSGFTALTQYAAVSALKKGANTLVFDEFTCICKHVFLACITIVEPKSLVIVGDVNQCWLRSGEGESLEDLLSVYSPTMVLNSCYRCPCPDVKLLSKLCDYDIKPAKCQSACSCSSYEFVQLSHDDSFDLRGVPLCFSHSAQRRLESMGVVANTVRTYMGRQADEVSLFVFDDPADFRVISSRALRIVALSRHSNKLFLYSDLPEADVIGLLGNARDEMDKQDLVTDQQCEDFIEKFYRELQFDR
ncbi:p40 helicase [Pistachio virus X]|uniref:p40 helicase n=1 Tax=Pistachio virus X TaxID=2794236 RepID=A0A7T0M823_9VIRU|nr:p40 helicase [Pistachio virus X]